MFQVVKQLTMYMYVNTHSPFLGSKVYINRGFRRQDSYDNTVKPPLSGPPTYGHLLLPGGLYVHAHAQ